MPLKNSPVPDSLTANLHAVRLLANLETTGTINPGDKAADWKYHPNYSEVFSVIEPGKFRKIFKKLLTEKYGPNVFTEKGMFSISYYF